MSVQTRSQRVAQAAFPRVQRRLHELEPAQRDKYLAFARSFPTMIHVSGLAQASAFALAKKKHHEQVLEDLAVVVNVENCASASSFHERVRGAEWSEYIRLTREALFAATWIKRYAEALLTSDKTPAPETEVGGEQA